MERPVLTGFKGLRTILSLNLLQSLFIFKTKRVFCLLLMVKHQKMTKSLFPLVPTRIGLSEWTCFLLQSSAT